MCSISEAAVGQQNALSLVKFLNNLFSYGSKLKEDIKVTWRGESAPNGNSQPLPSCFTTTGVPSPSKPRVSELVLQRMKQFKRADPERLRHASEESPQKTALGDDVPRSPPEETVGENDA